MVADFVPLHNLIAFDDGVSQASFGKCEELIRGKGLGDASLCRRVQRFGSCKYGTACYFSHDVTAVLRRPLASNRYKQGDDSWSCERTWATYSR